MKNIFITVAVLLSSLSSYSYVLEAKSVADMIQTIKETSFEHKEDGMVFGFYSIKSCLYVSHDFAILKNYCVPKKEYPAKGYTIISTKFGIINLYQEETPFFFKRDVQINVFPNVLKDYISFSLDVSTIMELNQILEKMYYQYLPACWSTNASFATGEPVVQCSTDGVLNFDLWAKETQGLTGDPQAWTLLMDTVESAITK